MHPIFPAAQLLHFLRYIPCVPGLLGKLLFVENFHRFFCRLGDILLGVHVQLHFIKSLFSRKSEGFAGEQAYYEI